MKIKHHSVVALTWTLQDTLGEALDQLLDPVEFLIGGDDLFEVIEAALLGQALGAEIKLQIEPEEGFGDFDDQLIFLELRHLFPPELEEGMILAGSSLPESCNPQAPRDMVYTITEVYPEHLVLDGNHPLAGIALRLRLKVEGIRSATPEEIAAGSVGVGFFKIQPLHTTMPGNQTRH